MQQQNQGRRISLNTLLGKLVACCGALGCLSVGMAQAQVTVHRGLPPVPPVIPMLNETPLDQSINVSGVEQVPALPEFTFEAPRSPLTPPSYAPSNSFNSPSSTNSFASQYRVEVNATDPTTLALVKRIEPSAFVKGDRIQAGVFSRQDNAEILRNNLKSNGINANVVAVNANSTPAIGSGAEDRGYFVAIPLHQEISASVISKLQQAGVNNALIQEKAAPRGRHIAVGPFFSRQEASAMDLQIRGADLDSRVYYAD